MATQNEIERKFLIKPIQSWMDLTGLFDNLVDIKRISQTYLQHKKGEPSPRVRKTISGLVGEKDVIYHYNKKTFIEKSVNKEEEYEISEKEYNKYLKKALPDKFELHKTRFVFKYKDQIFELDIFKHPLDGLAILEIELKNKNDNVNLPPFLNVIKEITGSAEYNNFNLANKK